MGRLSTNGPDTTGAPIRAVTANGSVQIRAR